MESGPPPSDRPPDQDEEAQSPPPTMPSAPPPGMPSVPPPGPEAPAPGPQSPAHWAPPEPPASPAPEAPPAGPAPGGYTGPVPPGGWQQPPPPAVTSGVLASWGSRLGAYVLDLLILLVPTIVLIGLVVIAFVGDEVAGVVTALVAVLAFFAISLLYAPLLMMRQGEQNGQTWGKQALGIRVVRDEGQPFNFATAALREVVLKGLAVGIASSVIPIVPWFLNFFWPLWDDENRALHDMAVKTHVVRA